MGLKGNNSKDKLKQESSGRLLSMSLEKGEEIDELIVWKWELKLL